MPQIRKKRLTNPLIFITIKIDLESEVTHVQVVTLIDSFKGSIGSVEAGEAAARGIRAVYPDARVDILPLADGGEGTMDAVIASLGGKVFYEEVTGPLGEKVSARYGIVSKEKLAIALQE